jgi:hypothetical protein
LFTTMAPSGWPPVVRVCMLVPRKGLDAAFSPRVSGSLGQELPTPPLQVNMTLPFADNMFQVRKL